MIFVPITDDNRGDQSAGAMPTDQFAVAMALLRDQSAVAVCLTDCPSAMAKLAYLAHGFFRPYQCAKAVQYLRWFAGRCPHFFES
jgi:hypothetical protein